MHQNSFKSEYFHQLARLEENNFWFCSRNRLILWGINRFFSGANSFFEIGCGTGFVLSGIEKKFPHFLLYGGDIYTEGIKFAKQRLGRAVFLQMDARQIPFEDKFDVIGAFDVLEHIKDDELVLSEIHHALHKEGGLILTVPQHSFLWGKFDEGSCHLRRYSSNELKSKVEKAGFKVIRIVSFISLLFPLMIISRLKGKWSSAKDYNAIKTLEFNSLINTFLEKVLDFERVLIGLGVSFPFGGSLFLIAAKT